MRGQNQEQEHSHPSVCVGTPWCDHDRALVGNTTGELTWAWSVFCGFGTVFFQQASKTKGDSLFRLCVVSVVHMKSSEQLEAVEPAMGECVVPSQPCSAFLPLGFWFGGGGHIFGRCTLR